MVLLTEILFPSLLFLITCYRKLDCGNHTCEEICHPSECRGCKLQPSVVTHCPCGKEKIVDLLSGSNRKSCLDPIPTCGHSCDRPLPCAIYHGKTASSCLLREARGLCTSPVNFAIVLKGLFGLHILTSFWVRMALIDLSRPVEGQAHPVVHNLEVPT